MEKSTSTQESILELRANRIRDRHRALGLIAEYLAQSPVFSSQYFGDWTKMLMGQINRDHYLIAWRGERVVGFVGWARCDLEEAEAWLTGLHTASSQSFLNGSCMIINAWKTDENDVIYFLRKCLQKDVPGIEWIFGKRVYPNGTVREIRRPVRN